MKWNYRLPGNILILTLIVSVIFSILCTSVILLAYYNRINIQKATSDQKLVSNLESATNLVLADPSSAQIVLDERMDLFNTGSDSVTVHTEPWGIFRIGTAVSFEKNKSRKKEFMYGSALPSYMNGCLYLADHNRPLTLANKTKLTGKIYVPKAGIVKLTRDPVAVKEPPSLDGEIVNSEEDLPALQESLLTYLYKFLSEPQSLFNDTYEDDLKLNEYSKSFSEPVSVIYYRGRLVLEECNIKGHVILVSDTCIDVNETASLTDVILAAPAIHFKKGFHGTVQAIARDTLIVEPDCVFEYPSALLLLKSRTRRMQNVLHVSGNCRIDGVVLSYTDKKDPYKTSIVIEKHTTIKGIIYTAGYLTLNAEVKGSVLTDFFVYRGPTAVYENYLVDVNINRQDLSDFFIASGLFKDSPRQSIIKWLE